MTRASLPKGERRLLDIIERCDFTGNGCYPTQKELTFLAGFKNHRYTSRLVKQLEAKGFLVIEKRRRPGCKWLHNVYHVRDWNPQVRQGTCNLRREWPRVRAEQEACAAQSGLERTATAVVGSYAPGTSPSVNPFKRCQHAAGASRSRIARRPCVCRQCKELEADLAETRQLLAKAHDDLMGQTQTVTVQGKEIGKLKRELSSETTPLAQDVRRVLEFWQRKHPRANIDPAGSRAKVVRGAMKLGHTDPPLACPVHDLLADGEKRDKDARCTVADELIEALEGLALMPFVGPHGRCAEGGRGTRRFDGIEYALTDRKSGGPSEATIERFRGYARRAKLAPSEKLLVAYQLTGDVHETYARYLLDALAREQNGNGAHA